MTKEWQFLIQLVERKKQDKHTEALREMARGHGAEAQHALAMELACDEILRDLNYQLAAMERLRLEAEEKRQQRLERKRMRQDQRMLAVPQRRMFA